MRRVLYLIYYWFPPLVWMSIIFYMSSQHKVAMTNSVIGDFITFKSLHMVEYALLFFLLYRACKSVSKLSNSSVLYVSFFIAIIYSMTDEFHQLHIPSRSGKLFDVFVDICGMIIMYTGIRTVRVVRKLL